MCKQNFPTKLWSFWEWINAQPLTFDHICPHFKHIVGNILSKAVLKVRNYLKDHKSVTGEVEKSEGNFQGPIYMECAARALECPQLRVWRTWALGISFDRQLGRAMGRLGWNTYETSNFFGSPLRITYARRACFRITFRYTTTQVRVTWSSKLMDIVGSRVGWVGN